MIRPIGCTGTGLHLAKSDQPMSTAPFEVSQAQFRHLPVWLELSVVMRWTGLTQRDVHVLRDAGKLRTLRVGRSGKRVRYHKGDVAVLWCGFVHPEPRR